MITETYNLELITPCFCAGAEQGQAEFRAPSIRGKLRWWFRILGGTAKQEEEVFGSVAGNKGSSGALTVRTRGVGKPQPWCPEELQPNSNKGYLLYFARVSGNPQGLRWNSAGALPIGGNYELVFLWRRRVSAEAEAVFKLTQECFLKLGSLGLRASRGLGCFECEEERFSEADWPDLLRRIQAKASGFLGGIGEFSGGKDRILEGLGGQLRGLRQGGFSAGAPGRTHPTPLGSSNRPRQTSAVYLRPVKVTKDGYRIVVFEAPGEKVLEPTSRSKAPRLRNGVPMPTAAPVGSRRR